MIFERESYDIEILCRPPSQLLIFEQTFDIHIEKSYLKLCKT
jgi:hypothetical protein